MKRLVACCCAVLMLSGLVAGRQKSAAESSPAELKDLASLFDTVTGAIRDTNQDGVADAVVARVIVPAKPSLEDIEAATNIAARLGHETMALTLPLVVRDDEAGRDGRGVLPIFVGRDNSFVKQLADGGAIDLKALAPGQGLIAIVRSPLGGSDGVVVVGGDDEGTRAAGVELAARLPRVWGMSGITLGGVEDQTLGYLKTKGIAASAAEVTSLVVDRDRGIATLNVRVKAPASEAARAAKALEDLDLAHRRGQAPRTLNFANVAVTAVEIVADGQAGGRAQVARSGLNARTLTPPIDPDELAPDSPGDRGRPAEAVASVRAKTFDLRNAYSINGWFGDSYVDLIPDSTETAILLGDAADSFGAAHIAARLGLESTGVTLPIARPAAKVRDAAREPNPILVGRTNPLVGDLIKIGKTRLDDLQPGEGSIHVVPRAFGDATATVVAGADPAGSEAAALYLGRRVPYVWDTARGALTFSDVATEVSRFLAARSGAGQASLALGELDNVLKDLKDKPLESVDVKLYLESADPALDRHLGEQIKSALNVPNVTVTSRGITDPSTVFEDKLEIPWEVDEFWTRVKSDVLPKVKRGSKVDLEARLSESPQVRHAIADQVRAELTKAGATPGRVRLLSAYKQGFLWLTEEVIPELKGKGARAIHIKVAKHHPDLTKKQKFYMVPGRWLHELYPADEIFQRELGIPKDAFNLELVDKASDTYSLEATDGSGKAVLRTTFSPKVVEREYLDKFPGWSRVEVTTGWVTASVDGQTALDARIATDPDRFWDHYQSKVLPRIYDYVMKITDGQPLPDKQPFHRDLDIEVWMSEPDFRIGVDEEHVSSLESLHEDLYFVTLDFFDALGRTTVKRRLAAPGKIFPIIHPDRPGKPGEAHVLFAGNTSTKAKIEVSYKEKDATKPVQVTRELAKVDATPPSVVRVVARADRVSEIELQIEAKDDRAAGRAVDALDALQRLHTAGLYRTALSYDHVGRVAVRVALKDTKTRRVIPSTGAAAPSNGRIAQGKPKQPVVTWDHVISPDEAEEIVGKLVAYPEIKGYKAGKSYRGREISVMEITAPTSSELVSLAKATTVKPTIFITGRQHANEVSSTSHILRLAELLATDPSYKDTLKKVNVILHPVENPDGAQMAYELQKLTPTHILHAGRYSSLGMDVGSQTGLADPLLPEALVRGRLWRDWLPDIYLNPHGYPSHEWVQQFAGYVPPGFRPHLSSRGWYTGVRGLRDPRYPRYAQVAEGIRELIVREINSNPDVRAMNLRHQARYRTWAFGFQPHVYNQEIYKDTAIYYSNPETGEPTGSSRRAGATEGGKAPMSSWPLVTYYSGGTEAPDETAQGEWLNLVAKAGFSFLMANVKYLRDGQYEVVRIGEDGQRDSVQRTWLRPRPVLPGKPAASVTTNGK